VIEVVVTGFFLKLGSLAFGFEKKLESDCAPFTTALVLVLELAAVALVLGGVDVAEPFPSEASFLTTAFAPDAADIIAFFVGGAEEEEAEVVVPVVLDGFEAGPDAEPDADAESGCFRFLVFDSARQEQNEKSISTIIE
jgi:hypothetical protein